ncbi:hypothetical protein D031_4430A, partial [Vibrio parahaemolyticus VP-48]
MRAFLR